MGGVWVFVCVEHVSFRRRMVKTACQHFDVEPRAMCTVGYFFYSLKWALGFETYLVASPRGDLHVLCITDECFCSSINYLRAPRDASRVYARVRVCVIIRDACIFDTLAKCFC